MPLPLATLSKHDQLTGHHRALPLPWPVVRERVLVQARCSNQAPLEDPPLFSKGWPRSDQPVAAQGRLCCVGTGPWRQRYQLKPRTSGLQKRSQRVSRNLSPYGLSVFPYQTTLYEDHAVSMRYRAPGAQIKKIRRSTDITICRPTVVSVELALPIRERGDPQAPDHLPVGLCRIPLSEPCH